MLFPRFRAAVAPLCLALSAPALYAGEPRAALPHPGAARPAAVSVLDVVAPAYRELVSQVLRKPTLTAKASEETFAAHPHVYDWLLEHPDRAALAWKRMRVPCVEIQDIGSGRFHWMDENGSDVTWLAVGRFADGIVWYATGKVKPATMLPTIPVKAVAVLRAPRDAADPTTKVAHLRPSLSVYLHTDSRAANAILRVIGPAAPRMAEQAVEQLLLFFSGPARYISRHPERAPKLLAPAKVQ
jgi:hypothetical protein